MRLTKCLAGPSLFFAPLSEMIGLLSPPAKLYPDVAHFFLQHPYPSDYPVSRSEGCNVHLYRTRYFEESGGNKKS